MIKPRVLSLALTILVAVPLAAQQQRQELLNYSIVGSSSCEAKPCYNEVMRSLPVQRVLLDLASGPRDIRVVESVLNASGVKLTDLLQLRLIRREGDQYFLNFPLFTAADARRIREISEGYAGSLAQALLKRRQEIESVLRGYDAPGVDPKAVAYFVLGCASLDWDGLTLTASKGYRKKGEQRPDGRYVPNAEEKFEMTLERIYWGSHNNTRYGIHFTSFGDHYSTRYTFPDLFWSLPSSVYAAGYPDELQPALRSLLAQSLDHTGSKIGLMIIALRDGEKSGEELARAASTKVSEAEALLHVLIALDYVTENGGRYRANVPVLTKRDDAMTKQLLAIGNQVMDAWLAANYSKMKDELKDLSFTRSRVPFEDGFTRIWHYVFGMTNRKLVEAGLFADPYAPTRKYKGSIPAVFELDLQN